MPQTIVRTSLENPPQTTIWILTELYHPEQTSTSYFLTQTAEGLAQNQTVKVITGPASINLQPIPAPAQETHHQVEIFRCQGTRFNKNWLPGRFINGITRSLSIFGKALKLCNQQDILLVVTNPPLLPFIALLLKQIKGCRFILLVHDVYPEALIAAGLTAKNSLLSKGLQAANKILYQQASCIITLGRDMTQVVAHKLPHNTPDKIHCIPHWADLDLVHPTPKQNNPILQKLGISDQFVILYAGNLGRTHDIELLAKAAIHLEPSHPPIHFVFIGTGAKKQWLETTAATQLLFNLHILPFRPNVEKNISLNACDIAIISFLPGMAGISVPSRMYNQMAAGKPMIAVTDPWSELAQVIQEEAIGWVVPPGDLNTLIQTIQYAAAHPETCAEMGARAAIVAQTKYTFAQSNQAYQTLLSAL